MSAGLHRLWKDRSAAAAAAYTCLVLLNQSTVSYSNSFRSVLKLISKMNPFPGMKHLDVAGGTGSDLYLFSALIIFIIQEYIYIEIRIPSEFSIALLLCQINLKLFSSASLCKYKI